MFWFLSYFYIIFTVTVNQKNIYCNIQILFFSGFWFCARFLLLILLIGKCFNDSFCNIINFFMIQRSCDSIFKSFFIIILILWLYVWPTSLAILLVTLFTYSYLMTTVRGFTNEIKNKVLIFHLFKKIVLLSWKKRN